MSILILDSTNKSIKAVLSAAPETTNPDFVVSYADTSASAFTEVANDGALNGTTEVTLVSAPDANVRRVVKDIRIHNRDTTAVTITLKYDNNGTQRTIAKALLAADETYTLEGVFDSEGDVRTDSPVEPQITGITGSLFAGTTSSLTVFGQNFGTLQGQVQFVYGPLNGNTIVTSVGVTPTSNNELTVNVPLQIYSLSGGVSGYIKFIRSDGAGSNQFVKAIAANEITSITQNSGLGLTLTGTSFGTLQGTVRFVSGGIQADVTATPSSPTSISVLIPQAINNIAAGTQITVQYIDGNSVASNQFGYTPTLMKINTITQGDGLDITLTGTGFGTAQGVVTITDGTVTATVNVTPQGPTSIAFNLPQTINDLSQGTSLNFKFTDSNSIESNVSSFTPTLMKITAVDNLFGFNNIGSIAHSVTLTGTKFGNLAGSVKFIYGGVTETVAATPSSDTSIVVPVPATIYNQAAGTSGTITFTNNAGTESVAFTKALETAPTGGTITTASGYRIHLFSASSNFIVPTGFTSTADVLLVGGGGGGGDISNTRGAGGGAGGLIYISGFPISSGTYAATIGNGGAAASNGQDTTFIGNSRTLTAKGGGSGGYNDATGNAGAGGSTGGQWYAGGSGPASTQPVNTSDGISTYNNTGWGNPGGASHTTQPYGSGGGGAGAPGGDAAAATGPKGGIGRAYDITGTETYYAGGGGSAGYPAQSPYIEYAGGLGGGGTGSNDGFDTISNGLPNTGGGGGSGGSGGSGVFIIRYQI